jgi:hypothetical protein
MITCPNIGALRAALDDANGAESRRALDHAEVCPTCRAEMVEIRSNAEFARSAFALFAEPTSAPPRPALVEPVADDSRKQPLTVHHLRRFRWVAAAAAAVALVGITVVTPQGQTAAAQFLAQFRGQRLSVVTIDPAQARMQLPELGNLAVINGETRRRPETVSSAAEASARAGFDVKAPSSSVLPSNVQTGPKASVVRGQQVRFSFDASKAADYFKSIGRTDLRLPDRINGTTLVIDVPSVAMLEYAATSPNSLGLVVAQAGELSASTEGAASLEEVREYLLGLPTLSESTVKQLRAISDWRATLPIPVPVDQIRWQPTVVGSAPGYLFVNTGVPGTALVWNESGRTFGVLGDLGETELKRVADSLH